MRASRKEKLDIDEITRLIELVPDNKHQQNAKNLFLFSFFTFGMRAGDLFLLKWSNIQGNKLNYTMSKNNKIVPEIKLSNHALSILDQYRSKDPVYIFPSYHGYGKTTLTNRKRDSLRDSALVTINKNLKTLARRSGIQKNISMHVARHSFANISKEKGVSVEVLKEQLCHSDIKITYVYLASFNNKVLQDAGDSVYKMF